MPELPRLVINERLKLVATFLSDLGIQFITVGSITPLAEYLLKRKADDAPLELVWVGVGFVVLGLISHEFGKRLLVALQPEANR